MPIDFANPEQGKYPAREFLTKIAAKDRNRVIAVLTHFENSGRFYNHDHHRLVAKGPVDIWEIRTTSIAMGLFEYPTHAHHWRITHGFAVAGWGPWPAHQVIVASDIAVQHLLRHPKPQQ